MVSAECEPITGVWGGAPSWVQGQAEPLVRGSGAKPPEAKKPFSFWMPYGSSKFA